MTGLISVGGIIEMEAFFWLLVSREARRLLFLVLAANADVRVVLSDIRLVLTLALLFGLGLIRY